MTAVSSPSRSYLFFAVYQDRKLSGAQKPAPRASALHHLFHAKALATTSKTVTFTGDWNSVEEIEGSFFIDTADSPATISNVPAIVIENLQVKSSSAIDIIPTFKPLYNDYLN